MNVLKLLQSLADTTTKKMQYSKKKKKKKEKEILPFNSTIDFSLNKCTIFIVVVVVVCLFVFPEILSRFFLLSNRRLVKHLVELGEYMELLEGERDHLENQ